MKTGAIVVHTMVYDVVLVCCEQILYVLRADIARTQCAASSNGLTKNIARASSLYTRISLGLSFHRTRALLH